MKNTLLKSSIIFTAATVLFSQSCMAEINLNLREENKLQIELNEPAQEISDNLFSSKEEVLKYYLEHQKKLDVEDIKTLWESTVSRNPVIMFALKKISLPPEKRRVNSSRFAKTTATLIRGASILPGLFGADALSSSAASMGGSLAGRALVNKSMPKEMPITDTELIQLARLVESLQDKIIRNYYDYKGNVKAYEVARQNTEKYGKLYRNAREVNSLFEIIVSNNLYNKAKKAETELKQKIKLNRLELERLAGEEAVDKLTLKGESKELALDIADELNEEKEDLTSDLQVLWSAGVENSETIRFAILKLSNPKGEIEKASTMKRILSPLASVAPIIGLGLSDPVTASSTMFGGNLLNSVLSDDNKKINAHLSKVTDADLVMLAQETDSLQEKLIELYHNYLSALIELDHSNNMEQESKDRLDEVIASNPDLRIIAEAFYNEMHDAKLEARRNALSKRVALEQFVGNEALLLVDKNIKNRLGCNL